MLSGESPATLSGRSSASPKILTFHKIQSGFSFGVSNYAPQRFERLLVALKSSGYVFRSLTDILSAPNPNDIAFTFDDGYLHLLSNLLPLVEQYQLAPTIFVPTGWIGKPNRWDYSHAFRNEPHLNVSQIKQLADAGVEFGSHGHSHTDLTSLSHDKLKQELLESKETLEQVTGQSVDKIAYPFGRSNQRVIEIANPSGYKFGFTTAFPLPDDNDFTIGRFPVYGFDSSTTIRQKMGQNGLASIHRTVSRLSTFLSGGTVLLNRLRSSSEPS